MRRTAWPPSRVRCRPSGPSGSGENGTPRSTSHSTARALCSAMKRAVFSSTRPAPASCVSRTCDSTLSSLPSTPTMPPRAPDEDYWPATRQIAGAATQFVRDKEDYLENLSRDIGRKVGPDQYELFVSCDPAEAMQLQVEHLHPEFIAVHDIGTTSSRR